MDADPRLRTAGSRFRDALDAERPLQIVGAVNAYTAKLAERAGFRAIYLSGAGVANASFGLPDLGLTSLAEVLVDARRITSAVDLPLLVDVDTGWGGPLAIERTVHEMLRSGVAAIHVEDQIEAKRCGHRAGKQLVTAEEMAERIAACVGARGDDDLFVIARTDAAGVESFEAALDRARDYVVAGADGIFAEALTTLEEYRRFSEAVDVPVLANVTEFGRTPLFTLEELREVGVGMVLYPLSAFRAMSAAATKVFDTIRGRGTQAACVDDMQTRAELYEVLGYEAFELRQTASRHDPEGEPE